MQRYFSKIEALDDSGEVLLYACQVAHDHGVVRQSYHFTPIFDEPNSVRTVVHASGFSEEWVSLYEQADFRIADPIPARTMAHGALLRWRDAMEMQPNTPENERYFAAMREYGLEHGIGIPLFGPRGRNAYASFDFDKPIEEVGNETVGVVRSVAQAAHQRVCVLLDGLRTAPELSERETEVMHWIARGKSTSVIAQILDLSPETVKTYSKRIYAKLGTSERVGATVKALKLGLVSA